MGWESGGPVGGPAPPLRAEGKRRSPAGGLWGPVRARGWAARAVGCLPTWSCREAVRSPLQGPVPPRSQPRVPGCDFSTPLMFQLAPVCPPTGTGAGHTAWGAPRPTCSQARGSGQLPAPQCLGPGGRQAGFIADRHLGPGLAGGHSRGHTGGRWPGPALRTVPCGPQEPRTAGSTPATSAASGVPGRWPSSVSEEAGPPVTGATATDRQKDSMPFHGVHGAVCPASCLAFDTK